jgi:hypothetical protein
VTGNPIAFLHCHLLSRSSGRWNRSTASWSAPALTLLSTALGGRLGRLPARTTEALLIYPRFPRFAQLMPAAEPMLWKTARMIGCLECQTTSQVTTAMTVTVSHPSIRGIGHENDDAFGAYRCHRHRLVGVRPARRPRDASRQAWRPRGAPRQADAGGDMGIAPARLERAAGSISTRAMT